jgi:NAD(P)-dependent dehydrogenase (short-subunit alcohol dehydrogenase family)
MNEWQEREISVVLIGNGSAFFAEAFREDFALTVPILVDPDLVAYRAAGLRRGSSAVVSKKFLPNAIRAMRTGARQASVQGDAWQLGGVFVMGPGGTLKFAHRSETAGDHADPAAITAAIESDEEQFEDQEQRSLLAGPANWLRPVLDFSPLLSFDRIGFARHALGFDPSDLDVDLYGQRCLVTGANSGIGYAAALALADLGAEVFLLCRSLERGQAAVDSIREATGNRRVHLHQVDLSDLDDVDRAVSVLSGEPVDVLVHNAGLLPAERSESPQGLELTLATHVAGPHRLTAGLRDALESADGGRIVWVSSGGMLTRRLNLSDPNWEKRPYDGVLAYAETKRAQVVLAELWSDELRGTGITVNSMHPGWADTPSVESSLPLFHRVTQAILRTPEEGADTIVWLAASRAVEGETGQFFFDRRAVRTHWTGATKESESDRKTLWENCNGYLPAE